MSPGLQRLAEGSLDLDAGLLALTTSHSHLRETRSSIAVTAVFALVKWVVSKIHNIPGR
jgi:hypothetical protein